MKHLKIKLLLVLILVFSSCPPLSAGGLVTGASRGYQAGDKVLFRTDFRTCPVGEMPEGFDKIDGVVECVKLDDKIWVAPSTSERFRLGKKIDLGKGDFSIEFTVIRYKGGSDFRVDLFKADKSGWDKKRIERGLDYDMQYCEIKADGAGLLRRVRGCEGKKLHFALQVRRGQFRVYLDGKRLASLPWPLKKGERVSGFALYRSGRGYAPRPYGVLLSDIKVSKYTKEEAKPTPEQLGIRVEQTTEGSKLTVPEKVLFDFNKFILKPEAKTALQAVVEYIRQHPAKTIVVTGYTDNIGTDAYNLKLSLQRAQSVADYLIDCGKLSPALFKIVGKGKADPIASNATDAGRARNRRVEIRLIR